MADEKRRIVYELLVEAKKSAGETNKLKSEMFDLSQVTGLVIKGFTLVNVALKLKDAIVAVVEANEEIQKLTSSLKVLGLEGKQLGDAVGAVQDIAVKVGVPLQSVANAYKDITDVAETLGLSQKEVGELTEAATQAMVAQGGTAEQAAEQIGVLTFAIEKGSISGKELKGVLKENEVLQDAFEKALGKTTPEILKMANAGKIGAEELKKVLDVYTELGKQAEVPATLANTSESIKNLGLAFGAALADALGLNTALRELRDLLPKDAEGAKELGTFIGDILTQGIPGAVVQAGLRKQAADRARVEAEMQRREAEASRFQPASEQDYAKAFLQEQPYTPDELRRYATFRTPLDEEGQALSDRLRAEAERNREARRYELQRRMDNLNIPPPDIEVSAPEAVYEDLDAVHDKLIDVNKLTKEMHEQNQQWLQDWSDAHAPVKTFLDGVIDAKDATQVLAHALTGIFSGATHNAREFFQSLLQGLAEVALQKALWGSGGEGEGLLGAIVKGITHAKGAAYDRGTLVPFAYGGVVGGPAMFGMTGGRTGLMGEAGPEGIMPLRRGRDGRLGVVGSLPQVQIVNNTGTAADAKVSMTNERMQIVLEAADLGRSLALEEVNRSLRSGYGPTAQSVQRTYGLRRRG